MPWLRDSCAFLYSRRINKFSYVGCKAIFCVFFIVSKLFAIFFFLPPWSFWSSTPLARGSNRRNRSRRRVLRPFSRLQWKFIIKLIRGWRAARDQPPPSPSTRPTRLLNSQTRKTLRVKRIVMIAYVTDSCQKSRRERGVYKGICFVPHLATALEIFICL